MNSNYTGYHIELRRSLDFYLGGQKLTTFFQHHSTTKLQQQRVLATLKPSYRKVSRVTLYSRLHYSRHNSPLFANSP